MAMLAEKRTKKRYNLVPRGKPLYEDANNIGTKMLEKMGWSKGKGLGANENGSPDFIRVQYKNDNVGIGFEDRDDGWTNHETHFEKLLKSLHNSKESSDVEEEENGTVGFGFQKPEKIVNKIEGDDNVTKLSGESLEEKSKKSKARVHYKKFTRGKDLSQYSEKDLANIFGRKELNKKVIQPISEEIAKTDKTEVLNSEHNHGVMTIISGTSIQDYFKSKMALLKARSNGLHGAANVGNLNISGNQSNNEEDKESEVDAEEKVVVEGVPETEMCAHKKKSKRKADHIEIEFEDQPTDENSKLKKLKKKSKLSNDNIDALEEINLDDKENLKLIDDEKSKKKRSKNIKKDLIEQSDQPYIQIEDSKVTNNGERYSNEEDNSIRIETCLTENDTVEGNNKKSKKKKRKYVEEVGSVLAKKDSENGNLEEKHIPSDPQEYCKKKVKRKQCKSNKEDELNEMFKNEDEPSIEENKSIKNENKISNDLEKSNPIKLCNENFVEGSNVTKIKRKKRKVDLATESEEKTALDNQTSNMNETTSKSLKKSSSIEVDKQNCREGGNKIKKSKRKNRKNDENPILITDMHNKDGNSQQLNNPIENVEIETETRKRKKHKKRKHESEEDNLGTGDSLLEKNQKKSKIDSTTEIEDAAASSKNFHENEEKNYEAKTLDASKTEKRKCSKKKPTEHLSSSNERQEINNEPKQEKESVTPPSLPSAPPQENDDVVLYEITSFTAEKFRHTNINGFPGSNLNEIIGYSLTGKVSVKVIYTDKDQQNITNMWNTVIDKYKQMEEDENNKPRSINFKRFKKKKVFVKV